MPVIFALTFLCFILRCQGISLGGFKVLLSVHTKERGRPGREGLVIEAYNQETSGSCILHLSASSLLKQARFLHFSLVLAPGIKVRGINLFHYSITGETLISSAKVCAFSSKCRDTTNLLGTWALFWRLTVNTIHLLFTI